MSLRTGAVARRFIETWNSRDLDALLAMVTEECTFDSAHGGREPVTGKAQLRAAWSPALRRMTGEFVIRRLVEEGDVVVAEWDLIDGDRLVARGIDVLGVHEGRISSKSGYVKVPR